MEEKTDEDSIFVLNRKLKLFSFWSDFSLETKRKVKNFHKPVIFKT